MQTILLEPAAFGHLVGRETLTPPALVALGQVRKGAGLDFELVEALENLRPYLAAGIVPPEVAEELNRHTPEEREEAWGRVGSRLGARPKGTSFVKERHVFC